MKRANQILWGVILIVVGLVIGLNAFGITHVELFFDGWWTLFIIIPCFIGLLFNSDKMGNIIGLCIGVFLLLCCQDILDFGMLWKLLLPTIIILFGIKMIFGSLLDKKCEEAMKKMRDDSGQTRSGTAVFSSNNLDFSGEEFHGVELNAVFGGIKCDLRNAVIVHDCVIQASAIFGGIDILVPNNINIKVNSNSIFGGISNKSKNGKIDGAPTLYIKGICMFGGVDIK